MKIVVCIKQVPDTVQLKFDSQNNPMLDNVEWLMNPCCSYAVETALQLKETQEGSTVIAISLGGPKAKDGLKRAIAMGCDEAFQFNNAASDAYSIAHSLADAIWKQVPDFDLLLFGQYTDDAMHGITGPMAAEFLNVPSITLGSKVTLTAPGTIRVERQTELGLEGHEMTLPGMVCMANSSVEPRIPSIKGVMRANRTEISFWDAETPVSAVVQTLSTVRKPKKSGGTKIDGSDAQTAVDQLITYLKAQKAL